MIGRFGRETDGLPTGPAIDGGYGVLAAVADTHQDGSACPGHGRASANRPSSSRAKAAARARSSPFGRQTVVGRTIGLDALDAAIVAGPGSLRRAKQMRSSARSAPYLPRGSKTSRDCRRRSSLPSSGTTLYDPLSVDARRNPVPSAVQMIDGPPPIRPRPCIETWRMAWRLRVDDDEIPAGSCLRQRRGLSDPTMHRCRRGWPRG